MGEAGRRAGGLRMPIWCWPRPVISVTELERTLLTPLARTRPYYTIPSPHILACATYRMKHRTHNLCISSLNRSRFRANPGHTGVQLTVSAQSA